MSGPMQPYPNPQGSPDEMAEAARLYRIQRAAAAMHEEEQARTSLADLAQRARGALMWSRVFFVLGVLLGIGVWIALIGSAAAGPSTYDPTTGVVTHTPGGPGAVTAAVVFGALLVPFSAYSFWSFYWGWLPTWRVFRRLSAGWGCFGTWIFLLIVVAIISEVLVTIAQVYGFFGGGIYQWRKAKATIALSLAHPEGPTQTGY